MNANEQLERLYKKLQQIVQQHARLQKENKQLHRKLADAQQQNEIIAAEMFALQQKLDAVSIINSQISELDKKSIEKRINQYIKDIDKCIEAIYK